jgi:hypothetical protein
MFAREVMRALYRFQLLDKLFDEPHRVVSTEITTPYLAHRAAQEPDSGNPLLRCIKRIAISFQTQVSVATKDSIVRILPPIGKRLRAILQWETEITEVEYEQYRLAAAIRIDCLDIVRKSLINIPGLYSELKDLRCDNLVYGCYDRLVAIYGSQELIEYMLTYGTPTVNTGLRHTLFVEAARCGRAELVRYIYEFQKDEVPWGFESPNTTLLDAQNTASLEVLQFVAGLREMYSISSSATDRNEYSLSRCVDMGQLETVKHAIELGAHPRGLGGMGHPRNNLPVERACRRGHTAIVEYLLACGAGPERTVATAAEWGHTKLVQRLLEIGLPSGDALGRAAQHGYLDVVQMLLNAGADPNESTRLANPLVGAIANENTAMFILLIERGADLQRIGVGKACVQRARQEGLNSMLQLLQVYKVNIDLE